MARLWKVIDGEPFMVNPRLGILGALNPKKGKKSMAKRKSGRSHMAWVRSFRKGAKRRRKRNPFPVAGFAVNPRRRRRRRVMARARRRRAFRRNPAVFGLTLPPLQSVLYVGAGFVGVPLAEGFLSRVIPASLSGSAIGKYAVRVGAVIGLSMLAKMVLGREEAKFVGIGGGAYVLVSAVREFAPGMIPGLNSYVAPSLGAYAPARRGQLRAATAAQVFGSGRSNVLASRFRRFS
jgi:hypothetical protein